VSPDKKTRAKATTAKEPAKMIEAIEELEWLADKLKGVEHVAIDMESDSFYVYHEKVCLLQLTAFGEDFVIDPLAVKDISPLGPMFRDSKIEKIFHAGEYDIVCLKRDYGFEIRNIFDTMVAARTLGLSRLGLAPLIEEHFGVKLSKKLQRANWGKRPLTPEHIEYARNDTRFLHELRDRLAAQLEEKDLLRDAQDEFKRLEKIEPPAKSFDPDHFWHLHGARELTGEGRAVLKRLYVYREKTAARLDRAPFRVMPEDLLVRVAQSSPDSVDGLRKVKGMSPYLFRKYGKEIFKEVEKGRGAAPIEKPPKRPKRDAWDGDTMRRYEALRQWRKEVAAKRGVNPVVILPTEDVRLLAQAPAVNPDDPKGWLDCVSEYKRESYGPEILAILKAPRPQRKRRRRSRKKKSASGKEESAAVPAQDSDNKA
jgi:ribonuclease D